MADQYRNEQRVRAVLDDLGPDFYTPTPEEQAKRDLEALADEIVANVIAQRRLR